MSELGSNYERYFWTTVWIALGIVFGIIPVIYFSCVEKLNIGSPLLWSFAYLVMGALLGFIFSVPKMISENNVTPNANTEYLNKTRVEENTNLTQVSDWLTKVLIGAGLVQLREIPGFILHVAQVMGQGMRKAALQNNLIDSVTIMCAAIILYFMIWGFISGYLVMKLILTEQFADTNNR